MTLERPPSQTSDVIARVRARLTQHLQSVTSDRTPIGNPNALPNDGDTATMTETAERIDVADLRRASFMGPRGRDPGGQPLIGVSGLPPAAAGEPHLGFNIVRKEHQGMPGQSTRAISVAVTALTGRLLDRDAGHPIHAIQISNYSRQWLYVPAAGRYVPPYMFGIQFPVFGGPTKLEVHAGPPGNFTQPDLATTTEEFEYATYERQLEFSPGTPLLIAGYSGAPTATESGVEPENILDGFLNINAPGTTTLITIPAGRTWSGQIAGNISAENPLNTATGDAALIINTAGAGATPAAGALVRCDAELPATAATALVGVNGSDTIPTTTVTIIAPAANAVTLTAQVATTGTVTALLANAWAVGTLL